ncbi:TetR/AcrR family transcriptional regulator [Pseudolysinimonas sp.]|jgi:AcrR family transcriptional regulator|uniref:TetR/AcrR family transcriptional regulator n=1 Tax=Pseudolysinimonas sp. TaxID=2680009 RepID=UPI003784D984
MPRDNRNARGLATARALERAAVLLADRDGVDAVTVDRICAAVGVTQRTFFNHFDTKEDALLGLDLPRVDEARAREYLADPGVGVLSGALALVEPPPELTRDPEAAHARFAIISASPDLMRRQASRFLAVAHEVEQLVALKLRGISPDEVDDEVIQSSARTITAMAAALMIQPGRDGSPALPSPAALSERLRALEWIWPRLL